MEGSDGRKLGGGGRALRVELRLDTGVGHWPGKRSSQTKALLLIRSTVL